MEWYGVTLLLLLLLFVVFVVISGDDDPDETLEVLAFGDSRPPPLDESFEADFIDGCTFE
jgi:hypothetical protein